MKNKVKIYNPYDDDGFQIIYINDTFFEAIHTNDSPLTCTAVRLLERLNIDVEEEGYHADIKEAQVQLLLRGNQED